MPWLTILAAGLLAALYAAVGPAPAGWVYDRAAVADGQAWRLFSGHLVHSDAGHLAWNLAGLAILGAMVESLQGRAVLLAGVVAGSLVVDLVLWVALPGMAFYCGFSGILNALLPLALAAVWRLSPSPVPLAVGGASLLKIFIEQYSGQALFTDTAWASVPLAHLAGWIGGLMIVLPVGRLCATHPQDRVLGHNTAGRDFAGRRR